jgi:hypothetical protein
VQQLLAMLKQQLPSTLARPLPQSVTSDLDIAIHTSSTLACLDPVEGSRTELLQQQTTLLSHSS